MEAAQEFIFNHSLILVRVQHFSVAHASIEQREVESNVRLNKFFRTESFSVLSNEIEEKSFIPVRKVTITGGS